MPAKPILIYRLTPAQIALVDRLAVTDAGLAMDKLEYPEIIAYQELEKVGLADMRVEPRKRICIVLTDIGRQVIAAGYVSRKPVVRLTGPQIDALRFLVGGKRYFNDIPAQMKEPCRKLRLRGWADTVEEGGKFWTRITTEGWQILKLLEA